MINHLTDEQKAVGKANAYTAIGSLDNPVPPGWNGTRRDFLIAAGAAGTTLGAMYFGYGDSKGALGKPAVRAVVIGCGNEGCDAMIRQSNRDYVNYIGYCDARPFGRKRAKEYFAKQMVNGERQYTDADIKNLIEYDTIKDVLDDTKVEMVVIALPLWLHAPVAIDALKAGKHVFSEKLMAHNITECKEMIRAARGSNRLLAVGHQRHYSAVYDNANALVQSGMLGDIRHIRASWHRNNSQIKLKKQDGELLVDADGNYIPETYPDGNLQYFDSWKPGFQEGDRDIDLEKIAYKATNGKTYRYDTHDELIRWRLYDKTGAGLMAELGSHQLDASSIFLGKKKPLAVTGVGGSFYYDDGREVDDHVFVNFEFPAEADDQGFAVQDNKDRVVVSYSSITTNAFEPYGETIMGNKGTLMVIQEYDVYLYKEYDRNNPSGWQGRTTAISVEKSDASATMTSPSMAGPSQAQAVGAMAAGDSQPPSRGYREELEHFAWCIRYGDQSNYHADTEHQPRCHGVVAMADAVIALTSNIAMRTKQRVEYKPEWFDPDAPGVPEDLIRTRVARA